MQLSTTKAVRLLGLFSQLQGYPQAIELQGRTQIVVVPYDIGPKAQWNAVKNRRLLRPIKDMSDELMEEKRAQLDAFLSRMDPNLSDAERNNQFAAEQKRIDADQKAHFDELHEISGLLAIPAKDIRIRRTDTVIQEVLEGLLTEGFLDGEPIIGEAPPK